MSKLFIFFFSLLLLCSPGCGHQLKPLTGTIAENRPSVVNEPYVILVSLDGFRWDYVERFQPPHLTEFIENGVAAESLISCFPSKTFPNHYSIVTGMYPEHHGLVDNSFYNPEKRAMYRIGDREKVEDGTWYGGTPLWVQAAKAGMVTASFFFVGSEADIQGMRPSYYFRYDGAISNEKRVKQALKWLKMPEKKRPHLITMYFSDMDNAGHDVGPNADEKLREKLMALDEVLGQLFRGVQSSGLPVNVLIVSDHGMTAVPVDQLIPEELIENDDLYYTVHSGTMAHINVKEGVDMEQAFEYLKSRENHFTVYKTEDVPAFEIPPRNPSWGQIQVLADPGWFFMGQRKIGVLKMTGKKELGQHGYDPVLQDMHGIFYANGPAFRKRARTGPVKNIHVYPLICKILKLPLPPALDGKPEVLQPLLR